MQFLDNGGVFLVSNSSDFGFGFNTNSDLTSFTLVIIHRTSSRIIWSANRDSPVQTFSNFTFANDGNAYLQSNGKVIWSTNTAKKGVVAIELLDSGNMVLVNNDGGVVWQSFSYPTNTLLPNQSFLKGMKLVSNLYNNLSFSLQIKTGDAFLSAEFKSQQPYWSMGKDTRRIINKSGGDVNSATIEANSWRFYDENGTFLWQFVFADEYDANATWVAVLEDDGFIKFYNLYGQIAATRQIPDDSCSRPQACSRYYVCHDGNACQCASGLAQVNCKPQIVSSCNKSSSLVSAGENLSYFALRFVSPSSKTDLAGCKSSCLNNCTCLAMFFDKSFGNCYLFDQIGSFEDAKNGTFIETYIKVSGTSDTSVGLENKKQSTRVVIIVVVVVTIVAFFIFVGIRYYKKKTEVLSEISEDDAFLENVSGMPVRFTYKDLQEATNDFAIISGRRNYSSSETSHFPAYAFRMMEEGKVKILLDEKMKVNENDTRPMVATRVALWCIQDDVNARPSMTKVVQMLEQLRPVPSPPEGRQASSGLFRPFSELGTSLGPSNDRSDVNLSNMALSGPR
ncbi:hypothetical protein QVD17_11843 [Tagetes erecta]|uniref:Bulb-type lectin domain-containing protein n=1 Tax=Tagetes erecta TaxID=13708 RepID=A0AAD8KU78_TARER|nr:hypothetical protein QVD17_11843 [Tagetes erecta]